MTKHIGIVACSAEGAALCYLTICIEGEDLMSKYSHPEITMHTYPFNEYMQYIEVRDWDSVADLMLSSSEKVVKAGADFIICPDNTIHQAFDLVSEKSSIPWLNIAEVVADEAAFRNYRVVGLLGTSYLMKSSVYPDKLEVVGIEHLKPKANEQKRINEIIFNELVYGRFTLESRAYFIEVIEKLRNRGCNAVVLGCTEIPLIVTPKNSPLPTLDSTRLLARSALRRATLI